MSQRLHEMIAEFARFGGTADGGVCRLTATQEDAKARDLLGAEIERRNLELYVDPIGNMFGVATLAPGTRETVIVGSHLDSQPTGGRFDGCYGVLAALLATENVIKRAKKTDASPKRNLALVNWTNEEGARFQPSLTGSSVFAGSLPLPEALSLCDGEGVRLGDALDAIGYRGNSLPPIEPVHYAEIHVEQGARLEEEGCEIGVVTAAWAARKLSLIFHGQPSHTGPTPMKRRRDALRAAARAIELHYSLIEKSGTGAHASAARITAFPNSPNVTPGQAQVWFEFRHESQTTAFKLAENFLTEATNAVRPLGVEIEAAADECRGSVQLDSAGAALALAAGRDLGYSVTEMTTVEGHDSLALQKRIPASLILVPSRDGLSHNAAEFTEPAALDKGLDVLTETLWRLVTR